MVDACPDFLQSCGKKVISKSNVDREGNEIIEIGTHQRGIVEELEKAHIYIHRLNQQNKDMKNRLKKLEHAFNILNASK
jgi:hypothetical protein